MKQKFDIGLNAKIKEFVKKFNILRSELNDNDVFEEFGNYVIASNCLEEEIDNVKSVSTNKAEGIDGVVILVNNKLIAEYNDLNKIGQNEDIVLKIAFIQSTTQNSFKEQKFKSFVDSVVSFLTNKLEIEPFSTILFELLNESNDYYDRFKETPKLSLFFLSAITHHNISEEMLSLEYKKFNNRIDLLNKYKVDKIQVLQENEIKLEYEKISKFHTTQLKFENSIPLTSVDSEGLSLLAVVKFAELKKLILTSDDNLKEYLFIENVRNYIGSTPVNKDIKRTLDSHSERNYFPFLNNGLAIICDNVTRHPLNVQEFILSFPRIINGCQTTNELFKKYKESSEERTFDNIEVVVKVISTKDNNLKKLIIHAANNQNSIEKDLQSLNDYHIRLETYFEGKDESNFKLYFERMRGQHTDVFPPYSKIDIETLARVYISVLLKKPHEMKSKAQKNIDKLIKDETLFNHGHSEKEYYYCAVLWYWFNYFSVNSQIEMKSKSMDMHLLMVCDFLVMTENNLDIQSKINYLNNEQNAKKVFFEATTILNSKEYFNERRGYYSNPKTQKLIDELNGIDFNSN